MASSLIFCTDPDSPYDVELAGVGVLGGSGRGGIPVERAAKVMRELQDDDGEPLSGAKLRAAAEKFAEEHGLATRSVRDLDEEQLRVESGAFPSGPTIREVAEQARDRDAAFWEASEAPLSQDDLPVQETAIRPEPTTADSVKGA